MNKRKAVGLSEPIHKKAMIKCKESEPTLQMADVADVLFQGWLDGKFKVTIPIKVKT